MIEDQYYFWPSKTKQRKMLDVLFAKEYDALKLLVVVVNTEGNLNLIFIIV